MPIFDSACYVAGSQFHIPAFGSRRNPAPTTPEPRAANEAIKRRKAELKKLVEADDVIRYDKYHAANLLSNQPPPTSYPTPPTSSNLPPHVPCHVTHAPKEHERATSRTHNSGTERRQRERLEGKNEEIEETQRHKGVAGEVKAAPGK